MKHRIFQKIILSLLILVQLFNLGYFCIPTYASSVSEDYIENLKQERIDELFTELNELALKKKIQQTSPSTYLCNATTVQISATEAQIEQELTSLGIKKIDPLNTEDISRLNTLVEPNSLPTIGGFDFSMLANLYSIYEYNGTRTIKGKTYDYKYYRVIDNKGYVDSPLTESELIVPVAKVNTTIGALLDYNFSYGFSTFLGFIPGGGIADWVLGNIFTALESYNLNSSVVYNNNTGIYSINMISVTAMTYFYIKVNDTWYQCGSNAGDISFARTDSFSANINGQAYADSQNYPNWNSSTGHSWYWYLENFVNTAMQEDDEIGDIKIYRGSTLVHTFSPAFISNPWGLI